MISRHLEHSKRKKNEFNHEYCFIQVPDINGTLTKSLYEHFKLLYRYTEPSGLEVDTCSCSEEVPVFENVNKIFVREKFEKLIIELNDLEYFLTQYAKLETLVIQPSINGEFKNSSKIEEIENIHLAKPGRIVSRLLSKFTGKNIDLSQVVVTESVLNEFIRKWMKSVAYHSLESLNFELSPECVLNNDLVFDQLETEKFEATKRPQWYYSDSRLFNIQILPIDFSGDNCYDVIREKDGKRASILSNSHEFIIVVWN